MVEVVRMEKEKTTLSVAQAMALAFATTLSHFEIYFLFTAL